MKISVGKKVRDLAVISSDNKKMLSDYLNKNLILYFYPRDLTPGCTTESNEFNNNLNKIKKLGWNVVGVSRDTLKSHEKFIDKYSFKFPLISDEGEKVCKMFDVIKEKSLYGRKYMGIDRSTFLINREMEVLNIWRNVKVKGHVEEEIKFIKEL